LALKQYPEATAAAQKALAISKRLAVDFPDVPHYQRVLADAYRDLADVLENSDQPLEALQAVCQGIKIQEQVVAADPSSSVDRWLLAGWYADLGGRKQSLGRGGEAVSDYRRALEFDPKNSGANNDLAWLLALGAEPSFKDTAELVRLARTATEESPEKEANWVTLGLAYYRAGNWSAGKAALEKPSKLSAIDEGMRCLVLAMTEWKLGNQAAARTAYERAIERLSQEKLKPADAEGSRLHAEAAQLLGITDRPPKP
jgi:tetratricopeptide (TPR) repeat protein